MRPRIAFGVQANSDHINVTQVHVLTYKGPQGNNPLGPGINLCRIGIPIFQNLFLSPLKALHCGLIATRYKKHNACNHRSLCLLRLDLNIHIRTLDDGIVDRRVLGQFLEPLHIVHIGFYFDFDANIGETLRDFFR